MQFYRSAALSFRPDALGILWSNQFSGFGKPSSLPPEIFRMLKRDFLLSTKAQFEILQPDVVIFTTARGRELT